MPIIQVLEDNDKTFRELKRPPIFLNDLSNSTNEDREKIQRLITTTYSSDMVSILPSCKCGAMKGEFVDREVVCERCKTPISVAIEDTIEPLVWFRKPNGVEKLMSPILWVMLEERLRKSKYSILRWLTDTGYSPQTPKPQVLAQIEKLGIQRGYNHFIQNFFPIIEQLFQLRDFRLKRGEVDYLHRLLLENKDILFADQVPMLNKMLLIIEKTSLADYIDSTVPMALNSIEQLISIDRDFYDQTTIAKENRTARALAELSVKFYSTFYTDIVAGKPGLLRHYVGGSRFDYSARAVIGSRTDAHRYDEILIPWGVGLTIFRPMLYGKLVRDANMLPNDAVAMLQSHIGLYHPLLDQYMKEIISSTKEKRYPVLINRFPSLLQGSIQKVYIPYVKPDPNDKTISISILITTAPNAKHIGVFDSNVECKTYLIAGNSRKGQSAAKSQTFKVARWDVLNGHQKAA